MGYKVRAFKVIEQELPAPVVYLMKDFTGWETLYYYVYLIRGNGRIILLNAGPPDDLEPLQRHWEDFGGPRCRGKQDDSGKLLEILNSQGIGPCDVDAVIVTPLVSYATGGLTKLPRAQICISKRGWLSFHTHAPVQDARRRIDIPDDVLSYLIGDAWERVRLLEEEAEVFPGIRAFFAGIHHASTMGLSIETAQGNVTICDAAFKFRNLEENIPIGIVQDLPGCFTVYERVRKSGAIALPGYDPKILERFPNGEIA